jgi:Ser/Thr protein kinase RdoA (MazF antagonist)
MQYRASPWRTVIRFDTTGEPVFFKSTTERPFRDACVGRVLFEYMPRHFSRTLAFDEERGWCLSSAAPGRSLADHLTVDRVRSAMEAIASNQIAMTGRVHLLERAGAPYPSVMDLVENTIGQLACCTDLIAPVEWDQIATEARQAYWTLRKLELPVAWIHGDLAGDNIFMSGENAFFIDLNESWIGPAPIAAIDLLTWLRHRAPPESQERTVGWRDAYLSRWPASDRRRMLDGWPALESIAHIARAHEFLAGLAAYSSCEHRESLVQLLTAGIARRLLADLGRRASLDTCSHQ